MDKRTRMIKHWCEDELTFDDLTVDVQKVLVKHEFVTEDGKLTELGKVYKEAVTAKPDPNYKPSWNIRP